jgi:GWxTD domain-containing protein
MPANARLWLTEDVVYIISPEERCAFLHLKTDTERNQFSEQFWHRRSSDPDLPDNEFKREHYRRIAFANEEYGDRHPRWKTDRGRIYILFGAPDSVELRSDRSKSDTQPGQELQTSCRSEQCRYQHLLGIADTIGLDFDFVGSNGEYRLVIPQGYEPQFDEAVTKNAYRNSKDASSPYPGQYPAIRRRCSVSKDNVQGFGSDRCY